MCDMIITCDTIEKFVTPYIYKYLSNKRIEFHVTNKVQMKHTIKFRLFINPKLLSSIAIVSYYSHCVKHGRRKDTLLITLLHLKSILLVNYSNYKSSHVYLPIE